MKIYYAMGLILLGAVQILQINATTCKNGGSPLTGNYPKCSCRHGYKGYDCNQRVTPCEGNPCRNFGKCIEDEDGSFSCICSSNYEGLLCERRVRPCDSHPCKHGGNCTDDGDKCFTCKCLSGYKGNDCSEKITPCEVFPCKNGGVCVDENDGSFKCACKSGFGGIFCQRKDELYSSYVLDGKQNYVKKLEEYLGGESEWRRCYRASADGWAAKDFHDRCDHKGPTVTLVRVGYIKDLKIFGGYTDISWGGSTAYKQTTNSFIFSLQNKKGEPFKSVVYQNKANAIYTNPGYGPTFGGGHDLHLATNANANGNSYSNLGHTYKPPFGYKYNTKDAHEALAGSKNFHPVEVEVYYLR